MSLEEVQEAALEPKPRAVLFRDPRPAGASQEQREVGVVAFYYPDREEVWDKLCGSGFLGNFFELGEGALQLEAPCEPGRPRGFRNAEAAFQALKFWQRAEEFSGLSGSGAFRKKRKLQGSEDFTYGGFGSNWKGMWAVLKAKFQPGSPMADALLKTGDSFLLEHNAVSGRDKVWSDNSDGEGSNWLGLQLMLLRDQLSGEAAWTPYVTALLDPETGKPKDASTGELWQAAVRDAQGAVMKEITPLLPLSGTGTQAASVVPVTSAEAGEDGAEEAETLGEIVPADLQDGQIRLLVRQNDGQEVELRVMLTTLLRVPMAAACSRLGLQPAQARFSHGGRQVGPLDTAEVLGLQDLDILEVEGIAGSSLAIVPAEAMQQSQAVVPRPPVRLDLEWSCPSCGAEHRAATALVVEQPRLQCVRCGWCGLPELLERAGRPPFLKGPAQRPASQGTGAKSSVNVVASSGEVLEKDFENQHVEAPVGGLLALVSQVQRERLFAGFVCYFFFCATFVTIVSLARPVATFFDVQGALHQELVLEPPPLLKPDGASFSEVSDWGDFWAWVDRVLMDKVYSEKHYGEQGAAGGAGSGGPSSVLRANHSHFSIGKYNRLLTAIRFRQVRVKPTLPECVRKSDGFHPTPLEMACSMESFGHVESCDTPAEGHQLSRPCWGFWSAQHQDITYPSAIQMETAPSAPPEQDLLCLQSCDAYYTDGLRSADEWPSFQSSAIRSWTGEFALVHMTAELALAACHSACESSSSQVLGNLSEFAGLCGSPHGKPPTLLVSEQLGCFGDVVDLPLQAAEAQQLVAAMKRERWTNEGTRGLAIEINTYNPNYDIGTAVRARVNAHPGGRLEPSVEMFSCRFSIYATPADGFRLCLEVIFACWIGYYLLVEAAEIYAQRLQYFSEVWNYVELANLCIYVYTMSSWFVYINGDYKELGIFRTRSTHEYRDLYTIAKSFNRVSLASFNLIYGFIRFTKYFRMHVRFKMLWDTLAQAMRRVLPLLLVYLVFLSGFTWSGHWLFGQRVERFSSIPEAAMSLVLSVKDGIRLQEIREAAPAFAVVWYAAWFVCSSLLVLNLLLTVVISNFSLVKEQTQHHEQVEQEALRKSLKLPSLLITWIKDNLPLGLIGDRKRDKLEKEAHDNITELTEALFEVDLEALWARLQQGVTESEVAVDAAELKFLFGGSQRKARLFINRVCNLAQLPRVEVSEAKTTLQVISELGASVEHLGDEIDNCRQDLEARYPKIRPLLQPEHVEQAQKLARLLGPSAREGATQAQGDAGKESTGPYRGRVKPPTIGELHIAAGALDMKRQQLKESQGELEVAAQPANVAVSAIVLSTDAGRGQDAISKFLEATPLRRL